MLRPDIIANRAVAAPRATTLSVPWDENTTYSVHALMECPPLANCQFVLIDRTAIGAGHVLAIGDLDEDAPTLNLANLRYLSANLGTAISDIKVHVFSPTPLALAH
ncbi:MAG: hypothetical protein K2Y05_12800 [Hyphomicrobiaceae bacterium]|nr:hypothetical protein [Hyphomicrobiaceae bacterium]